MIKSMHYLKSLNYLKFIIKIKSYIFSIKIAKINTIDAYSNINKILVYI